MRKIPVPNPRFNPPELARYLSRNAAAEGWLFESLAGARHPTKVGNGGGEKEDAGVPENGAKSDRKGIFLISTLAGIIGGLCCVTPIVLVMLGLASISVATDLGNVLYGQYRWLFRGGALLFLALALFFYFRSRGICTLDAVRRERNRIINTSLLVLIFAVGTYILWTYVAVHYWGIAVGLPWAQYDESWAIPASALVLGAAFLGYWLVVQRTGRKKDRQAAGLPKEAS